MSLEATMSLMLIMLDIGMDLGHGRTADCLAEAFRLASEADTAVGPSRHAAAEDPMAIPMSQRQAHFWRNLGEYRDGLD